MPYDGYPMTGRDPHMLDDLIAKYGSGVWMGGADDGDRGDRHYRPDLTGTTARNQTNIIHLHRYPSQKRGRP